ncbi:uncharacterized mitochondrial protein-like protein, partial [Tanacetum coccineum]
MAEIMEQYMTKTQDDYGSGIVRPKFNDKVRFELKGQFLKELHENTFNGSDNKDANEHIERVLEIADLFTVPDVTQDQLMLRIFTISLTGSVSRWIRNESDGSITTWEILKGKILSKYCPPACTAKKMEEINNFQQEPDETLYQAWEREIKKVNKKVYATQVGCELCKGPHYTKDCSSKEEGKTLKEAYYTQFGGAYPQGGRYRAVASGFFQRDGGNPPYQERRQTMEETLRYFVALIKALEIQIRQISKVLQERGSGCLPSSTKTNLKDHVKSITTTKEGEISSKHRRIKEYGYDKNEILKEFKKLQVCSSESATSRKKITQRNWRIEEEIKEKMNEHCSTIIKDDLLLKERDPWSFTIPCTINNMHSNKALADPEAS